MNGARSIFMWKGYWLTALAAIVLLAASPGTAQAQLTADDEYGESGVKVDVPKTVAEGHSATITVSARAAVDPTTTTQTSVTVTLSLETAGSTVGSGDDAPHGHARARGRPVQSRRAT